MFWPKKSKMKTGSIYFLTLNDIMTYISVAVKRQDHC